MNAGCKSPSLDNIKNTENTKQFSDPQARKQNKSETAETKKESRWPLGACAIASDSMVNGTDGKTLQKHGNVFYFSGARINDMNYQLILITAKQSYYLILHVGTNYAKTSTSGKIIDDLLMVKCNILKQLPNCKVVVSKPTIRIDHGKANLTLRNVNKHLETLQSMRSCSKK